MDSSAKRIKYSEDVETQNFTSLSSICKNDDLEKFAIEYHNGINITKITYQELETTKMEIKEILERICASQFVSIDLETLGFCIPSLILGIISSGRAFINTLPSTSQDLFSRLKVSHLFSQSKIPDAELLHQLNIHGQSVQLLKLQTIQNENNSDFQKNSFAYAISTSGTTGVPTIVKVPHESIVPNIVDLKKILALTNRDIIAHLTTMTFDPSIVEIFLGFSSGGTLFMASEELKRNPRKLLEIMNLSKVSVFQTTPSVLLGKFSKEDLKDRILGETGSLRILILGGEPFPKMDALMQIRNEKNQTRIFNIYGITEVSCWASVEEFNEERKLDISNGFLGKALSETMFQVRSEEGKVVEEGEGILFIGSRKRICSIDDEEISLSRAPVFRNTGDKVEIDGTRRIFYKGRHNKIIKRFGNRVDLNLLENTILKMDSIQNCRVIWNEKNHKLHICISELGIVKKNEENVKTDLMNHLRNLPDFYRPDEIHLIDYFPLTSNGKICSRSLERIIENTLNNFSLNNVEDEFQTLWRLTTGSLETGFLKSGGTSVAALQIVNSLSEKFNLEFPELIGMLLKDSNFAECTSYLENYLRRELNSNSGKNIKFETNNNESSASSSGEKISVLVKETEGTKLIHAEEMIDRCLWQKCKGFKSGEDKIENKGNFSLKSAIKFQLLKSYDLKKCVDASPTVFQYSSGKIFATVGSHSGLIYTVELNSPENYLVGLPDRIEASVLVFDNFRGVVGCYDGNVYCLNLKTGEIYWKFQTGDAVKCTAATCLEKKFIFVGSYDKHMYCLSLETGSELWRRKASEGSISATARLHFETRSLLFGALNGTCISLDQVSGKIKWRNSLSDPIFSAPAIFKSRTIVFANVSGKLTCFNITSGQKLWTYVINGNIFAHLVLVKYSEPESIIFASRNKTLYHLECNSKPTLRYSTMTESPIIATPWHSDDIIVNACIDGTLQIIDAATREILASHKLDGDVFSSPVLHQDFVIVGSRDNKLYIFKLSN